MKTQVKIAEAIGKTVTTATFGEGCLLAFTDGTFAVFGAETQYESDFAKVLDVDLDLLPFGDEAIIHAGIATRDELAAMRSEAIAQQRRRVTEYQERRDREEFGRLARKFGYAVHGKEVSE